jgi:hypothetical protein
MANFTNNMNKELFTELTLVEAEIIQGGKEYIFTGYDYAGTDSIKNPVLAEADFALPTLVNDNDLGSVSIKSGTWRLYDGSNYSGDYIELGKESHDLKNYNFQYPQTGEPAVSAEQRVSSLKKVA